jgi:hypothetical protein
MARKVFHIVVAGQDTLIEVKWSRWSNAGEIRVDGKTVKAWGSGMWVPREVEFEVRGEKAMLLRKGLFWENWSLVIGGRKFD